MRVEPIYTRMFKVQDSFGVSEDTVRRWAKRGLVTIYRRGNCSAVRNDEMRRVFEASCGAKCGADE
uniref:hypothetical protein n=1 Tax=Yoonia sp. TaxID=2212373 RepID=UPI004047F200